MVAFLEDGFGIIALEAGCCCVSILVGPFRGNTCMNEHGIVSSPLPYDIYTWHCIDTTAGALVIWQYVDNMVDTPSTLNTQHFDDGMATYGHQNGPKHGLTYTWSMTHHLKRINLE